MSPSLPCPYCGSYPPIHQWAGEGQCPGSIEPNPTIATGSTWLAIENARLKSLCARAADALEHADWSTDYEDRWQHAELIAELRKAAE